MMVAVPPEPENIAGDRPCATKRSTSVLEVQARPGCKRSKAFLLRAGSTKSAETELMSAMAAAPFKRHAHENSGGGSNIPPAWGSAESQTSILQSLSVMGSGGSDAEVPCLSQPPPSGMAEVGAAAAAAAASPSAARAFQKQLAAAELQARKLQRYQAELAAANACLQSLTLPGGQFFYPAHHSCELLPMFQYFQTPPTAIALGASYFQRILGSCQALADQANQAGFFSLQPAPAGGHMETVMHSRIGSNELLAIFTTCVYLGIKMCEGPKYTCQLSMMLATIHPACSQDPQALAKEAIALEAKCLEKLGWRLGPYCCLPACPLAAGL